MKYADSTLMSFNKEQLIGIIRCLEHNVEVAEERNANQFMMLMEKEMYRWHDLRENPEDLPKHNKEVLVYYRCINTKGVYRYGTDGVIGDRAEWHGFEKGNRVIAWREIEPFEEE